MRFCYLVKFLNIYSTTAADHNAESAHLKTKQLSQGQKGSRTKKKHYFFTFPSFLTGLGIQIGNLLRLLSSLTFMLLPAQCAVALFVFPPLCQLFEILRKI